MCSWYVDVVCGGIGGGGGGGGGDGERIYPHLHNGSKEGPTL